MSARIRYNNLTRAVSEEHRVAFDRCRSSVVAVCACGWREVETSLEGAYCAAADHLERVRADHRRPLLFHGPPGWTRR